MRRKVLLVALLAASAALTGIVYSLNQERAEMTRQVATLAQQVETLKLQRATLTGQVETLTQQNGSLTAQRALAAESAALRATFNPRDFNVTLTWIPVGDDPAPERIAGYLQAGLADAWKVATRGRSVFVGWGPRPEAGSNLVLIVVDSSANARQGGWGASTPARLVILHEMPGVSPETYVRAAIHELGHVLGCCHGAGSDGSHIAGCPAGSTWGRADAAIMCPEGVGGAPTFNEYELAQMGL